MILREEEGTLVHYGTPRHSGRYPWGSGGNVLPQDNVTMLGTVDELRRQGLSEKEQAAAIGMTTTQLRQLRSVAKEERIASERSQAAQLKSTGMSNVEIGKEMHLPEATVRDRLKPYDETKINRTKATAEHIKDAIGTKNIVDVGAGVEHYLGVSSTALKNAVARLEGEGYRKHFVNIPQLGTKHETTLIVMAPKGMTPKEVYAKRGEITQIEGYSPDGGSTYVKMHYPESISSRRVAVVWKEDGGGKADGVIYVRRGVKDISLGEKNYAQVRILVDGTHYLKGMAMYKDDMPKGTDLEFHTNKSVADAGGSKHGAMKTIEKDPERPFNAAIRRQQGVMNIVNEQGDWEGHAHDFSSQFLSKQSRALAKQQLDMTFERRQNQLDEIMSLTNPTVRKKMLEDFAEDADSASVHLKAASLPRTSSHVILPIHSMKEGEVYAPGFKNGDVVALVRHPHAGPFEIPILRVNNKNREGQAAIGHMSLDAIGIHPKVAEKLSGADFDGDTVLVMRNNRGLVKNAPSLEGLKGFDPKAIYKEYPGMKKMTPSGTQTEMGNISNLITDMNVKGASHDEMVRAVRHSMVVIDAEKHSLDYKKSEADNGIKALKKKWQDPPNYGASTLISKASSDKRVPERKQSSPRDINPKTGERIFRETGTTYVNAKGKTVAKTTLTTKLGDTKDAHTLSSGTPIEAIYADHSNRLKAMANSARKAAYHTPTQKAAPSSKTTYAKEVASLNAKLVRAEKNAPLERQAQVIGNAQVRLRMQHNPTMPKEDVKKIKNDELRIARERTGAHKHKIYIEDNEWEAIQASAISPSRLSTILRHADMDRVKHLATPKTKLLMTSSKKAVAKSMLASGYTLADVAEHLGVSLTTLKEGIK